MTHNIPNVDHIHITEWMFANYVVGHETADQTYWAQIFFVNNTYVGYRFGPGWGSNLPLQITFQYTKTTDQPGSGFIPEDPQMVMMSDYYSEDEQVVGRWADGKPLYQKTYKNLGINLPASTWTPTGITFSDIDYYKVISNKSYLSDAQSQYPMLYRYYQGTFQAFCQWQMPLDELTLQYTKTTDAPGTGPTKGNLIYLPALYSEEEREVGVWTDGKPLYQKTINAGALPNSTYKELTTPQNIENLINASGYAYSITQTGYYRTLPFAAGGTNDIRVDLSNNILRIQTFSAWTNYNAIITIQYTKTTDQPGSATWTPEGQLAHHYSTSEKIVGTWIDGSTVYERTFNIGSMTAGSDKRVSASLSIDKIIDISGNAHSTNYNQWVKINFPHQNIAAYIVTAVYIESSQEINVHTGTDFTLDECYITLQYTKSS